MSTKPKIVSFDTIFEELCMGHQSPREFCHTYLRWCHDMDDFIDGDKKIPTDEIIGTQLQLMYVFTRNEFWQHNQDSLMPLIHNSAMTFLESERLSEDNDIQKRLASQLLKSQYQDIFYYVAYLVGGWEHSKQMSIKYRDYDIDVGPIFVKGTK